MLMRQMLHKTDYSDDIDNVSRTRLLTELQISGCIEDNLKIIFSYLRNRFLLTVICCPIYH